ncbi:hypothetical protein CGRA01v4_04839 [Colletotrichum graminicola]|nr:hypothetical protein CGRA01v4_04839 [Colletotrichum graminicola]
MHRTCGPLAIRSNRTKAQLAVISTTQQTTLGNAFNAPPKGTQATNHPSTSRLRTETAAKFSLLRPSVVSSSSRPPRLPLGLTRQVGHCSAVPEPASFGLHACKLRCLLPTCHLGGRIGFLLPLYSSTLCSDLFFSFLHSPLCFCPLFSLIPPTRKGEGEASRDVPSQIDPSSNHVPQLSRSWDTDFFSPSICLQQN